MPRVSYVNGSYVAHAHANVHVEDRGFQFADGVYEVIACIHGHLADEQGHLDRLERSLAELDIDMPMPRRTLQMVMRELLRRNHLKSATVYIQVTRGQAKRDFIFPAAHVAPSIVVITRPFNFEKTNKCEKGVSAFTVPDIRWKRRDVKSVALLPQVLARQSAYARGGAEAWLVDDDGMITEGAASNAWIVKGGRIITRPPSHSILRGVTRTALMKIANDLQMTVEERPFTPDEAYKADEAFSTGAAALIVPIVKLDDHVIGTGTPGPVARRLYDEYRAYADGLRGAQLKWVSGLNDKNG